MMHAKDYKEWLFSLKKGDTVMFIEHRNLKKGVPVKVKHATKGRIELDNGRVYSHTPGILVRYKIMPAQVNR